MNSRPLRGSPGRAAAGSTPWAAPAGALLLGFGASACQALESHTYNLRELHDEDGDHLRSASILSEADYLVQYGLARILRRGEPFQAAKKRVKNPLATCVENLLELSETPAGTEGFEAMKVENFARYALVDEWQLARQVCFDQLGLAGARLELERHAPPAGTAGSPVTAEELRAALAPLVDVKNPRSRIPEDTDVAAACRTLGGLRYDEQGILRALSAVGAIFNRESNASPHRAPLLELLLDLERRTVHMALAKGLEDPSPHVRAAAVRAGLTALGPRFLTRVLPRIGTEIEPPMTLAILEGVRVAGLPPEDPGEPGVPPKPAAQGARPEALALIYRASTEHPEDAVRVAGMRALGAVSGAGFQSLREEDWQEWWHAGDATPSAR